MCVASCGAALWCAWALAVAPRGVAADPAPNCAAPAHRQFDFWLGDWDVFDAKDLSQVIAHVRVSSILNDCVLLEEYRDLKGNEGRSFSLYDASRDVWHQSWVTNRGRLLIVEGHFHEGIMELSGTDRAAAGAPERSVRGTWKVEGDGVRELAVRSEDGQKTWQPWFDLLFRPHRN
jgi:hypothetical protein